MPLEALRVGSAQFKNQSGTDWNQLRTPLLTPSHARLSSKGSVTTLTPGAVRYLGFREPYPHNDTLQASDKAGIQAQVGLAPKLLFLHVALYCLPKFGLGLTFYDAFF